MACLAILLYQLKSVHTHPRGVSANRRRWCSTAVLADTRLQSDAGQSITARSSGGGVLDRCRVDSCLISLTACLQPAPSVHKLLATPRCQMVSRTHDCLLGHNHFIRQLEDIKVEMSIALPPTHPRILFFTS